MTTPTPLPLASRLRASFARLPIRSKLLVLTLVPLLVASPLLGVALLVWSSEGVDRLLETKVRSDLAVAHGYFDRVLAEVSGSTAAMANSHALYVALGGVQAADTARGEAMTRLLADFRRRERVDFVNLRAPDGRVLNADHGAAAVDGLGQAGWLPSGARDGVRAAVQRLDGDGLRLLDAEVRQRVPIDLVATRNAAPTARTQEDRALVLVSTQPVRSASGELIAQVQAGYLLNRNLPFIDHINEIVYPEGSLPFGSRGTATLFLDDVRISTNVRLFANASGGADARVSQQVRDRVLGKGQTWLGRAFVVNEWYVSGYQPLVDAAGQRVGMLYVGVLEKPFVHLKYAALAGIGAVFFAVMVAAAWLSMRWARVIFRPIEQMEFTMRQVEVGALDARVGAVGSDDEIGRLAGHLDQLLDTIADKTLALKRWNAELDAKVVERTQALADTQAQLVRSEKLATIGQLAASIAHEVNNPIAVIQGNLDLLRELLGRDADRVRGELKLVDEQIERMRLIVTQLLQFARPNEYAGYVQAVDPGRAFDDCLLLVGHLLVRSSVKVERGDHATRRAGVNPQELKQVLVNLLVNALHAMPEGGTLALGTRDCRIQASASNAITEGEGGADGVAITITDSGPGLTPEVRADLFKPFVTRKKDGTGLGLWISRSIVERYGGDITASDRPDGERGAVFTVWLKAAG
jgi:two-component system, NtrC family, sensor kinase